MLQQVQYERLAANHATQVISDADLDIALAALERARAERTRALAERDIAALNLEKHRLVALFDALLDTRTPPPGSYVKTGMPVGTLTDPARRIRLEISSNELRKLQDGRLRVHLRDVRLRDGGALVLISASPTADASSGMHLAHLHMPENVIGSAGELVALQLVDPNAFAHLDRVLRKDEKGAHVLIVIDGVTQRVAWPPTNVNSLAGKPVVVMGSNKLADGSVVDIVALDELRQ